MTRTVRTHYANGSITASLKGNEWGRQADANTQATHEQTVRAAFPNATNIRMAVITGNGYKWKVDMP